MAKGALTTKTMEMDAEIGVRIRDLRKDSGLSQAQVAKCLGVTPQQIYKYENGRDRVSASALILICQAIGATTAEVLSGFCEQAKVAA